MSWHVTPLDDRLALAGELRLADAAAIWRELRGRIERHHGPRLDLDLSAAEVIDGAVIALVVELRNRLVARGVASQIVSVPDRLRAIVHLHRGDEPASAIPPTRRASAIERLGAGIASLARRGRGLLAFVGELALGMARPARVSWRRLPELVVRAGTDAIPIVALLTFLVGFVMAFQSARQLELYGANVYVADIVGISVTRELAPLMAAIIMSGRSGAAYAAELGTMRVSEEIDALNVMGFAPMPYLVLPRIIALALVAPVLALIGDLSGIAGGLAVAGSLDVSPRAYLAELRGVLVGSDAWTGLVKATAFGTAIGFIGCYQGFATRGAAAGVGRSTTATVVYCLFTIVIIDTLFTILFRAVNV